VIAIANRKGLETMKTTRVAVAVMLGTLAASDVALARQAHDVTTTPFARQTLDQRQPTPAPIATTNAGFHVTGPFPQGFSVVLVMGDLQGSGPTDDVPQAARKALMDMKDFLPYKSYKLLDAAWVMCCAEGGRRMNLSTGQALNQSSSVTTALRGPEEQEFELQLRTYRTEGARIFVKFELKATAASPLEKLTPNSNGDKSGQPRLFPEATRSIIDTSFTMDVGETVVVGTSRLKAGSKALIALLTAVPPRNGAGRD
jgi:hypothetical protein